MTWSPNATGRSVPYWLQQATFKRDHWTCTECGYVGRQTPGDLHADHIVNRAAGGEDVLDNMATKCVPCHEPKTRTEQRVGKARRSGRRRPRLHPADALSAPTPRS